MINKEKYKIDNKDKEDNHIFKQHNKSLLLYHIVFPVKYRKKIITKEIENTIKEVCCNGIELGYEIKFIEIGLDLDHIHFLIQGIPSMSVSKMITIIKSITAKEVFNKHPYIKKELYGGNLWTSGYYVNTVGEYANREVIINYVRSQGQKEKDYKQLYSVQLDFDFGKEFM